mmetsp:Transcript_25423/g.72420  ORF Transcript_25423/g.72420 Transcript_25423/m.72420 type:complete len:315 (-) Transcript_25423:105-1049(-)
MLGPAKGSRSARAVSAWALAKSSRQRRACSVLRSWARRRSSTAPSRSSSWRRSSWTSGCCLPAAANSATNARPCADSDRRCASALWSTFVTTSSTYASPALVASSASIASTRSRRGPRSLAQTAASSAPTRAFREPPSLAPSSASSASTRSLMEVQQSSTAAGAFLMTLSSRLDRSIELLACSRNTSARSSLTSARRAHTSTVVSPCASGARRGLALSEPQPHSRSAGAGSAARRPRGEPGGEAGGAADSSRRCRIDTARPAPRLPSNSTWHVPASASTRATTPRSPAPNSWNWRPGSTQTLAPGARPPPQPAA